MLGRAPGGYGFWCATWNVVHFERVAEARLRQGLVEVVVFGLVHCDGGDLLVNLNVWKLRFSI